MHSGVWRQALEGAFGFLFDFGAAFGAVLDLPGEFGLTDFAAGFFATGFAADLAFFATAGAGDSVAIAVPTACLN